MAARYVNREQRCFDALFLSTEQDGQARIAAVLVLRVMPGGRTLPPVDLLSQIASQLLELGDVTGVPIAVVTTRND